MDPTTLAASLNEAVPAATFESAASVDLHTTIFVSRDDLPEVAGVLRDHPDLRFALLAELTAIDLFPREPRFELTYLFVSLQHRHRLRVKVRLRGSDARI